MARRLIDISVPLQNGVPADPPGIRPTIQYNDHQRSLPQMLGFFEGLRAEDLPDGQGWAMETVQLSTHNGTHLDAPWHYHPTMNRGERSWTIDEVPLEWCLHRRQARLPAFCRWLCRDHRGCRNRTQAHRPHPLSPLQIVVVNTSAGAKYGQQDYVDGAAWVTRRRCICSSAACG
jgi:kynurenine formamidase